MAATDHPSQGYGLHRWQAEVPGPDGGATFLTVESTAHPRRSVQQMSREQALAEAGEDLVATTTVIRGQVTGLVVAPRYARKAPPLWWAEVRESAARPPAVNLIAFTGHGVAEGALLDASALADVRVDGSDQVGAVRWYAATGEVDQIYVQPAHRRQGVAGCLIVALTVLSAQRGWARPWTDGQRTALGEAFVATAEWNDRTAPLTHLAPPMTPGES